ncbi:MAG: 50S ribosomal protein L21 [Candidatus Hydrothermota bacterium]|nr:MAG: 50S ribosomal protein L21 [Candidatus Hydrothermae bacterium]
MYAIFEALGMQVKAKEGDQLLIPKVEADVGDEIVFNRVLMLSDGENAIIGSPTVPGAKVVVEVLQHKKLPKIIVFKFKRRKNYRRKRGHRQQMTEVRVKEIAWTGQNLSQ